MRGIKMLFGGLILVCLLVLPACRSPLSGQNTSATAGLTLVIRLPENDPGYAASDAAARVLLPGTVRVGAALWRNSVQAVYSEAVPDASGMISLIFSNLAAGPWSLLIEAYDSAGLYARGESSIVLNNGSNSATVVLFPSDPVLLQPGFNAASAIPAGRTGLFSFTLPKSGNWTILSSGNSLSQVWGHDGRALSGFTSGSSVFRFPTYGAGQKVYLASRADEEPVAFSVRFLRSPTAALSTAFGGGAAVMPGKFFDKSVEETIVDMIVLPDGKLLVVGTYTEGDQGIKGFLARYSNSGSLDPAFGEGGWVMVDRFYKLDGGDTGTPYIPQTEIKSCVLQTVGGVTRILVLGIGFDGPISGGTYFYFVARYNLDGSPDAGFGNDGGSGFYLYNSEFVFPEDPLLAKPAVGLGGRILLAANCSPTFESQHLAILALLPDGSALDTAFGENGRLDPLTALQTVPVALSVGGAGYIYLAGYVPGEKCFVSKLNPDGSSVASAVPGFGNFNLFHPEPEPDAGDTLMLDAWLGMELSAMFIFGTGAEEAIYLAATNIADSTALLSVFNADSGLPKYSGGLFDENGAWEGDYGYSALCLSVDPDKNILIGGQRQGGDYPRISVIKILHNDGAPALDASFGSAGYQELDALPGGDTYQYLQTMLLSGTTLYFGGIFSEYSDGYSDGLLFRHPNGAGTVSHVALLELIKHELLFRGAVALSDGSTVAVGHHAGYGVVAKFRPDGQPDSLFGNGGLVLYEGGNFFNDFRAVKQAPSGNLVVVGSFMSLDIDAGLCVSFDMANGLESAQWGGASVLKGSNLSAFFDVAFTSDGATVVANRTQTAGYQAELYLYTINTTLTSSIVASDASWPENRTVTLVVLPDDIIVIAYDQTNLSYLRQVYYNPSGTPWLETPEPALELTGSALQFRQPVIASGGGASIFISAIAKMWPYSLYAASYRLVAGSLLKDWGQVFTVVGEYSNSVNGYKTLYHPDGRLFVTGNDDPEVSGGHCSPWVLAINSASGTLAADFGNNGLFKLSTAQALDRLMVAAVLAPAGDIHLCGYQLNARNETQGLVLIVE